MWSGSLWNGKRMRNEGYEEMGFPQKRSTATLSTHQQRWSQGGERFLNQNPYMHQNPKPIHEESPLGLRLKKSPSFLALIQRKLSQEKALEKEELKLRTKNENHFKASTFSASHLRIGSWEYKTVNAGSGLVVKFYYAKHKLAWEVLHRGLKYKIEIQWSEITALHAKFPDDEPATLSLVLGKAPIFFKETDLQPKKHTLWHKSTDFTGGQASTFRHHFLKFPPGVLDKPFKRLVQCDSRLGLLNQLNETILRTPYFLTIAANPRQLKDGVINNPGIYNLHDIPPISVPQDSPLNLEPLVSYGLTDDSSTYTQSPLSDTLTSFDHGFTRLEESPISSLHDMVLLSPSSSVPKNIFGPVAGSPNTSVMNGDPLNNFSNFEEQISFDGSHKGFSGCEVSLEDLLNDEPEVSFGIPHEDLSKATHHTFSGIGTCATPVNTNSKAHIFDSLEGPNFHPPLSVDDYEDQLDFEKIHQALLSDSTTPDENFLMPRVESLINILQSDQNSKNNPMNRLANSEENVLEPVIAHGLMPEYNAVAQEKNLNDSEGVLNENLYMSKVDSVSTFLQCAENNPLDRLVNSEGVQDDGFMTEYNVVAQEKNLNNSDGVRNENILMFKVDSLSSFLQYNENNPMDRLVNLEGVQNGKVLEPVNAYGSTPDVVALEKKLNDSEGVLNDNFLMSKVDSISNFLEYDENNHSNRLVNSEGVQDGKVLEPVNAYGSMPEDVMSQEKNHNSSTDCMQMRTMPRNDSCVELLHNFPRIGSLPHICGYGDFRY